MKRLVLILALAATTLCAEIIPASRLITWQGNVGIPGGVPPRLTIYQTLNAGATMAQIQSALNACTAGQTVKLGAGTFTITGTLVIPSNVTLRGSGRTSTILNLTGSGNEAIRFGTTVNGEYAGTATSITSGYTKGSTSIVVASAAGISVGTLLVIDQLNDAALPVSITGSYGDVTWASRGSGARAMGQTVEVTGVAGTTITFTPALYWTLSSGLTPQAVPYTAGCDHGGVEDLQVYANNSGYLTNFYMGGSKYCWIKNVESNFADRDHVEVWTGSFRCEVRDSYFHDGYQHTSGTQDNSVFVAGKSSGCLIENNILERMHVGVMLNWGAAGNVIAYNYGLNTYDSTAVNVQMVDFDTHGAHPMFNLYEGNVAGQIRFDVGWGSSSHNTVVRNWLLGDSFIEPPYDARGTLQTGHHANQGMRAVTLDAKSSYDNIVGNVVGSTYGADHDVRQVVRPTTRTYTTNLYLFSLGYAEVDDTGTDALGSTLPYDTGLFHGNYDYVTAGQVWDGTIADHAIPNSYYLASKPAFFGNLTWPAIDPASPPADATVIPAGYRYINGQDPPAEGSTTSTTSSTSSTTSSTTSTTTSSSTTTVTTTILPTLPIRTRPGAQVPYRLAELHNHAF